MSRELNRSENDGVVVADGVFAVENQAGMKRIIIDKWTEMAGLVSVQKVSVGGIHFYAN